MKPIPSLIFRALILVGVIATHFVITPMSTAADPPAEPKDPELDAKKREADLAEAEARLQEALKKIALAKKDAQGAANSDLQRAEQDKAKAEADKAIADAEKAKLGVLPTPTSKPSEGKVDLDDKAGYYADILAHETVRDNATAIAHAMSGKLSDITKIFLVPNPDYLKGGLQLHEIRLRLTAFGRLLDALPGLPAGGDVQIEIAPIALAAIPAVLGSLADIAGMFRVDRSIKGRTTAVGQEAFLSEMVRALHETKPAIHIVRPSLNTKPTPQILTALQDARDKADAAADRLVTARVGLGIVSNLIEAAQAEVTTLKEEITSRKTNFVTEWKSIKDEILRLNEALEKTPMDKPAERKQFEDKIKTQEAALTKLEADAEKKLGDLNEKLSQRSSAVLALKNRRALFEVRIAQTEAVLKAFTEFTGKLVAVPDGAAASPLATLAETSILQDAGAKELILTAAIAGQGGEVETRKSLWTSGRVYHRAGTACSYILFNNEGLVVDSGLAVTNRQTKEGQLIKPPAPPQPVRAPAQQ